MVSFSVVDHSTSGALSMKMLLNGLLNVFEVMLPELDTDDYLMDQFTLSYPAMVKRIN